VSRGHESTPADAVALCQGASSRLYCFGANGTTRTKLTLPATRTAIAWTASDRGLTYVITKTKIAVQRDGRTCAQRALEGRYCDLIDHVEGYALGRVLGRGGSGTVYEAHQG
jgi:hypothetical protein